MLHSPELAELIKVRLEEVLRISTANNVNVMLRDIIQDVDKHTGVKGTEHLCLSCGTVTRRATAYCIWCLGRG